jgi:hypothetical protein
MFLVVKEGIWSVRSAGIHMTTESLGIGSLMYDVSGRGIVAKHCSTVRISGIAIT